MHGLDRMAIELVDEAIDFADELNIKVHHLENDSVVLDFGVECHGGMEAGLLVTEIQTGGLATVQTQLDTIGSVPVPFVEFSSDHPARAVLCPQSPTDLAHGATVIDRVSGPGRLRLGDNGMDVCNEFVDEFDLTTIILGSSAIPSEEAIDQLAAMTGVASSGVFVMIVPPGSIAGTVFLAAQAGMVTIRRILELGGSVDALVSINTHTPVAPVRDTADAAGIALGSQVHLVTAEPVDRVEEIPYDPDTGPDDPRVGPAGESVGLRPAQVTIDVQGGPTTSVGTVRDNQLRDRWV